MKASKNGLMLASFIHYCLNHPEERFWQALRNWCGRRFVYVSDTPLDMIREGSDVEDTFYWKDIRV